MLRLPHAALVLALLCPLPSGGALAENITRENVWRIPPRELPPPNGASKELRAAIAAMPQPDVDMARNMVPKSADEWRAFAAANDQKVKQGVARLAKALNVSIIPGGIAGVRVFSVIPASMKEEHRNRLFLHMHGGAYVLNGGSAALTEAVLIAGRLGIPVASIDYRMPPDHPFPAALEDAVAVYRAIVKERDPSTLIVGGTSAGGGLVLATMLKLKETGAPMPAALFLGTPWADLTRTGDSFFINEGIDHTLGTHEGILEAAAKLYANGRDLRDPLLSPIYGELKGMPPTMLVSGTRDLFLSLVARLHRKLRDAGTEAQLHVIEGFAHGDYIGLTQTPESKAVWRELDAFVSRHAKR